MAFPTIGSRRAGRPCFAARVPKINRSTTTATQPQSPVTTSPPPQAAPLSAPAVWRTDAAPAADGFRQGQPPPARPSLDGAPSNDLQRAFPSFNATVNGVTGRVVPIDITGETLTVDVDK